MKIKSKNGYYAICEKPKCEWFSLTYPTKKRARDAYRRHVNLEHKAK